MNTEPVITFVCDMCQKIENYDDRFCYNFQDLCIDCYEVVEEVVEEEEEMDRLYGDNPCYQHYKLRTHIGFIHQQHHQYTHQDPVLLYFIND